MSSSVLPMFSSKSFIVSHLTVMSLIHLSLSLYMMLGSVLISFFYRFSSVQFSSVTQSCQTLCGPMNCSTPGLPVHHQLPEFTQTHVHHQLPESFKLTSIESVMPSSHLILCRPLLLLPLIPPSIRVFSNESTL